MKKVCTIACGALATTLIFVSPTKATLLASDDFNRADSNTLGSTPVGGYTWVETEHPTQAPGEIQITGNRVFLGGRSHGDDIAAELAGLSLQDLDVSVTFSPGATPSSTNYLGGLQYRLPSTGSGLFNVAGFSVTVVEDTWGGPLTAGKVELGGFGSYLTGYTNPGGFVAGTDYTLRVVANGSNHKVYLNGTEVINYNDPNPAHSVSGLVGIATGYGDYSFDNFSVSDLTVPEPASLGILAMLAPVLAWGRRK